MGKYNFVGIIQIVGQGVEYSDQLIGGGIEGLGGYFYVVIQVGIVCVGKINCQLMDFFGFDIGCFGDLLGCEFSYYIFNNINVLYVVVQVCGVYQILLEQSVQYGYQ